MPETLADHFGGEIPRELSEYCRIGEKVLWTEASGIIHMGTLKEWNGNVALVELLDGSIRAVEGA